MTINSLFYNLNTDTIEDFTQNGLIDLQRKICRTPLEPLTTFQDDPLRILRTIRFASRLGFAIAPEIQSAIQNPSIKVILNSF